MAKFRSAVDHDFDENRDRFNAEAPEVYREEDLTREEKIIYELALKEEANRPTIQEFVDFEKEDGYYTKEKVDADQAKLDKFEQARIDSPKTKRGIILEYILRKHLEQSNWAGEECFTNETTQYDDEKNKTDLVLEFVSEKRGKRVVHRLAVDVTSTQRDENYLKKQDKIREGLDNGKMARLKYFTSEAERRKIGFINKIPKAVLAVGVASIQRLSGEFVHSHELFESAKEEPDKARAKRMREQARNIMANNPVQILFLEQIKEQMQDQIMYAFGNLLQELDAHLSEYMTGDKEADQAFLKDLRDVYDRANKNWETNILFVEDFASQYIDQIFKHQALVDRLHKATENTVRMHLYTIKRLKPILNISRTLIKEKSGQIEPEVLQQTASRTNKNVVLRNVNSNLKNFTPPPALEDKLPRVVVM